MGKDNHLRAVAGLDTEALSSRTRGRKYLQQQSDITLNHESILGGTDTSRARSLTPRLHRDTSGLTSQELSQPDRRGRRHICHGGTLGKESATKSEVDLVLHQDTAQAGGISSAHHAVANQSMGRGKKNFFNSAQTHNHKALAINDPGGPDCSETETGKFKSFLGPMKRHRSHSKHEANYIFEDVEIPVEEFHTKKHYADANVVVHCSEEHPLGHSTGPDMHSKGFLGKSKHHFDGRLHHSTVLKGDDDTSVDASDLSAYGLTHRGRKKHFQQHNLESDLLPKSTGAVADLSEVVFKNKELHLHKPFHLQEPSDEESEVAWNACGDKRNYINVDDKMFEVLKWNDARKDYSRDNEENDAEFKVHVGHMKRCYGNAHNKSQIMLDYNDPPGHPVEEITPSGLKWGSGHGRRKLDQRDHLNDDEDHPDDAFFCGGAHGMGQRASRRRNYPRDPETNAIITPVSAQALEQAINGQDAERPCGVASGSIKNRGRRYVQQRDTSSIVQPAEGMSTYFSDEDDAPRIIRTKSAPSFATNPAPPSQKKEKVADRGRWKI